MRLRFCRGVVDVALATKRKFQAPIRGNAEKSRRSEQDRSQSRESSGGHQTGARGAPRVAHHGSRRHRSSRGAPLPNNLALGVHADLDAHLRLPFSATQHESDRGDSAPTKSSSSAVGHRQSNGTTLVGRNNPDFCFRYDRNERWQLNSLFFRTSTSVVGAVVQVQRAPRFTLDQDSGFEQERKSCFEQERDAGSRN